MAKLLRKMNIMKIRQAVIASNGSRGAGKNKLVSRSEGIDQSLATKLCDASPGRQGLAFGHRESINFFQPQSDTFAISRSMIGGLESGRNGGRRVVTHIALLERHELTGYDNNIVTMYHVLRSMGELILRTTENEQLPMIEIPDQTLKMKNVCSRSNSQPPVDFEKIAHAIEIHQQVVILDHQSPLVLMGEFMDSQPAEKRLDLSFSTGLVLEDEHRFNLQFFAEWDSVLESELVRLQRRTISFAQRFSPQLSP